MIYRLGDICYFTKGISPTLNTEPGEYPLVVTAAYRRSASTYQLEGPAVCIPLISSTGHGDAALHRVHYQEGRFALANLLVALTPKIDGIYEPKYLYHLFMTKKDQLFVPLMQGTANVSLKIQDIASVEIPLPPLEEQRRIVAHIDALAEQIAAARGLRLSAVEEAEAFIASKLNLLHAEFTEIYPIKKLRDVVLRVCDMNHEMPKEVEEGIPLVSPLNFTRTGIDYRGAKKISEYDFQRLCRKCPPQRDDILLTRYGAGYGNLRIVDTDEPFLASYSIAVITPDQTIINKRYLYWVLVSPHLQRQADDNIRASAMPDLGLKSIREFDLALPPLGIQDQIVAYLDSLQGEVERLKHLQAESAAELDALLPSLLDRAFRGEL